MYADDAPKIPAGAVASEDAELIVDLARQGPVKMKLVLTPQTLPEVESANVIGDIKGSEHPEQIVIVSGHLDSWETATHNSRDRVDERRERIGRLQAVREGS